MSDPREWEIHPSRHQHIITEVTRDEGKRAKKWEPDEMRDAISAIARGATAQKAAEEAELDVSEKTVKRVAETVEERAAEWEQEKEAEQEQEVPSEGNVFVAPGEEVAQELDGFFEEIGEASSLKYDTMSFLVVDDVGSSGDIPTGTQLMRMILGATSGVSNADVAGRIAEKYERFVQSNDVIQKHIRNGEVTQGTMQWGVQMGPQYSSGGRGQGMGGQQPGVGGPPGQQQPQGGQDPADSFVDQLMEFEEKKDKLQSVLGGGGQDEHLRQLTERLASLEQQIGGGGGGRGFEDFPEAASPAAQVAWLVENTEMSTDDAKEWVQENKDPEVMDIELEREKFQQRTDLMDNAVTEITGAIRDVFGDWEENLGDSIYENMKADADSAEGDRGGAAREDVAGGRAGAGRERADGRGTTTDAGAAAAAQEYDREPCPECGGGMLVEGDTEQCQNPSCYYGQAPCDQCGTIIELPQIGTADYGICPGTGCTNPLSIPSDPDADLECEECEWVGNPTDVNLEAVECGGCGEVRPLTRTQDDIKRANRLNL